LNGRGDRARQCVGEQEQRASGQHAGRQQQPLIVADHEAKTVGNHETDEPDAAGGGDRDGGAECGQCAQHHCRARDGDAERGGHVLAARENIEIPRQRQRSHERDSQRDERRRRGGGAAQVADQPEQHALHLHIRREGQQ
jgi:hypothetical protein